MKNRLRQNEIECLNRIKDSFIYSEGITKAFDNSDYLTMESILKSAYQNEKHSDFPDFFFEGGIIEHFEVTASNETHKGSQYKADDANCQRENKEQFKQLSKEFMDSRPQPGTIKTNTIEDTYECFSYESFVKSFKRNIVNHLNSLKNSKYENQIVVFLIEQDSGRLGVYNGDTFIEFYRLSEDKMLLEYLKETLFDINFVIFNSVDAYEIIDMSKIDALIKNSKSGLDIRGGKQSNITTSIFIDL